MARYGTDTCVPEPVFIKCGSDGVPSGSIRVQINDINHIGMPHSYYYIRGGAIIFPRLSFDVRESLKDREVLQKEA